MKKQKIGCLVSLVVLIVGLIIVYKSSEIKATDSSKGKYKNKYAIAYIQKMKNLSVAKIEKEIENNKKGSGDGASKVNDLSQTKTYFANSVFMGDSLTEPISYYELLSDKNVVGVKGRNVHSALGDVSTVAGRSPKKLFLLYGMNDLLIYNDKDRFVKEYVKLISALKEKMPKIKIYIESILPVTTSIQKKTPGFAVNREIEFNKALKAMTKKEGIGFIDVRKLIDSEKMYEPDGIHLKIDFYKKLLPYIMDGNY